jgi:hypothetical protein
MKKTMSAIALVYTALLLMAQTPVPEVTEEMKVKALKLGYLLNGDSMVRPLGLGSIDVSGLLYGDKPQEVEEPKSAPPADVGRKGNRLR